MMNEIKEIKEEMEDLRDKMNELTVEMLDSYDITDNDIDYLISEFADANVDVYYYDLMQWFTENKKAIEFVNEALAKGYNKDIMQAINVGQCLYYEDILTNDFELLEQYQELAEELAELEESEDE